MSLIEKALIAFHESSARLKELGLTDDAIKQEMQKRQSAFETSQQNNSSQNNTLKEKEENTGKTEDEEEDIELPFDKLRRQLKEAGPVSTTFRRLKEEETKRSQLNNNTMQDNKSLSSSVPFPALSEEDEDERILQMNDQDVLSFASSLPRLYFSLFFFSIIL